MIVDVGSGVGVGVALGVALGIGVAVDAGRAVGVDVGAEVGGGPAESPPPPLQPVIEAATSAAYNAAFLKLVNPAKRNVVQRHGDCKAREARWYMYRLRSEVSIVVLQIPHIVNRRTEGPLDDRRRGLGEDDGFRFLYDRETA
jgi:hypothetical protein